MDNKKGDFNGLGFSASGIAVMEAAYTSISLTPGAWDILKRRDVPGDAGFVDPKHGDEEVMEFILTLKEKLNTPLFGTIMRMMERISKFGWYSFLNEHIHGGSKAF